MAPASSPFAAPTKNKTWRCDGGIVVVVEQRPDDRSTRRRFASMRKVLLTLLAAAPLVFAQETFTFTYNGLPLPIFPDDANVWSYANIFVPRSIQVSSVTVYAQVSYSGVGDLNLYFYSANGTRTKLLERNCGGLQNIDTTFDDSASATFSSACPQAASGGPYKGNEPLANSKNENALGYWTLGVENNGSGNTGVMTGFSITITGTDLSSPTFGPGTVVSSTSFQDGTVAPGDLINIFGTSLGPTGGARAPSGQSLPTNLGSTTVTFDGAAAPLYFTSDRYIAAQVPTGLNPGSSTKIQVTSTSGSSLAIPFPVVPTKPGIFTYQLGASGQAKVINQDGSLNGNGSITGSDKPAPAGSYIQVYATGLGPLNPPVPQGTVAPTTSLSTTTLTVTATIGGQPATVYWAGAAPGLIGVYQVNVLIPTNTASGSARLVLSVGGNYSQGGVTIQVQ
jgi:uncharacterized protein (TIGR03437 family)